MDLFRHRAARDRAGQPLAERMRPRALEEVAGQGHLLGDGRLLARVLAGGELPSLILWGPPGSGKTTLARLLAGRSGARFAALSAVAAGLREVREVVEAARERLEVHGERTLLFLDEIHRFNKAQQDALLPHAEAGTVVLVGATTENPSFEVIAPLLSRCKVLRLEPLAEADLVLLLRRAIADRERGLGDRSLEVSDRTLAAIAAHADGDARRALTTIEVAAAIAPVRDGRRAVDDAVVQEALQRKTLLYDRAGEEHYNVVSAFIKSLRGSDPDAAVYWMARMLEAGEDPLFVARRMVIFAAEDVGLADPRALAVATAAAEATRFVGLPEAVLPLTEAALYLATAPKSNTALTSYAAAREAVREAGALPVPLKLRNAPTPLMRGIGYGDGYRYPHAFDGHYVGEDYLPDALRGRRFYRPGTIGHEAEAAARLRELRRKAGIEEDKDAE